MIKNIASEFLPLMLPTTVVSGRKRNTTFSSNLYTFVLLLSLLLLIPNQLLFAQSDGIKETIEKYKKNFFVWNEPEKENSNADSVLTVLGRWAWGPCNAVDAKGDYAYIGNGPTFQILDISEPTYPHLTGEYLTEGYIYDLEVRDNLVFVCIGSGILILDVSNPSMPQEISIIEISGHAVRLALDNSFVYLTTASGYMRVVDISDPANPFLRGAIPTLAEFPICLEAKDSFAYIGSPELPYMQIVDATNPDSLTETFFDSQEAGYCAFIKDTLLFVGASWFSTHLKIFNIKNLTQPVFVGQVEIEGAEWIDGIAVSENGLTAYALCLASTSPTFAKGVYAIDITDITAPIILDNIERGSQIGAPNIAVVQNTLLAAYYSGLCVLDITDPSNMQFDSFFPSGGFASKVQVRDSYAYIATGLAGLWILDISNPEKPLAISNIQTGGYTSDVVVEDSLAYIVNFPAYESNDSTRGLWLIDISDLQLPNILSHYIGIVHSPTGYWHSNSIFKKDNIILLTQSGGTVNDTSLEFIDVSNPLFPSRIGIFRTNYTAYDVSSEDTLAFLATVNGGLRIIDVSNPANPYEISNILNSAAGVTFSEPFVYTSTSDFSIINIDNPYNPFVISSLFTHTGASSVDLSIQGDYGYWADWTLGVVEISDPENPIQLTTFTGWDRGLGVAAYQDKVVFCDEAVGVWILRNNLITSVHDNYQNITPHSIALYQNYPNPFNPTTTIEFFIPFREKISLKVFDLLGREIKTLLNEEKESGKYRIEFNSYGLASGVYFYKLTAGDVTKVKKMLIIR